MSSSPKLLIALALACAVSGSFAQAKDYPGIGRAATPQEVAAWDIDVRPDFKGLPAGSGSVAKGQEVWEGKCASCHGVFGESNQVFNPLVGGTTADDIKTGRVATLKRTDYPGRSTLMKARQRVDAVGLHQSRHAMDPAQVAERRRGVRGHCLPAPSRRHRARRLHAVGPQHSRGAAAPAESQRHDRGAWAVARHRAGRPCQAGRGRRRPA